MEHRPSKLLEDKEVHIRGQDLVSPANLRCIGAQTQCLGRSVAGSVLSILVIIMGYWFEVSYEAARPGTDIEHYA